jgi:5-carboxymethyl-2-hydroxymuconate isomerase
MPHFIIDCSPDIIQLQAPGVIMQQVYDVAAASGLFALNGPGGIKVRINTYQHYIAVNNQQSFIHVFAYIMQGRTAEQKQILSQKIIHTLNRLFPQISIISINITDFEKATYYNKSMLS